MKNKSITFCSWPFALESVSRRETAVQGQTATTSSRVCRESTPTAESKELNTL
jgi:hypothetical protein